MTDARTLAQRHLVPHFTRAAAWRSPELPVLVRGEGPWVWDAEGRRFLDGLAGLFCVQLGHGRTDLAKAAAEQMAALAYATNWSAAHPAAARAAAEVAARAPAGLDRVFFVSSGSEANESAIKLARLLHLARGEASRHKVIARHWAYHGTTLGALAATGVPKIRAPFEPLLGAFVRHVPNTSGATLAPGQDARDLDCVRAIEQAILEEGPDTVSLVIAEPVQNGGGALVPPPGYWPALRAICDAHGVLLCADEVISGFGRVGHWFASERWGARPDLVTFAKGVTSGYQPLGGLVARGDHVEMLLDSPFASFVHGATFGGHPVATAVAIANLAAMRAEGVLENVLALEGWLAERLAALAAQHAVVKEVRGAGFFWALELMADRGSGRDLSAEEAAALTGGVLARFIADAGLLIRADDRGATCLVLCPPLVCDRAALGTLLDGVAQVLARTAAWLAGAR